MENALTAVGSRWMSWWVNKQGGLLADYGLQDSTAKGVL